MNVHLIKPPVNPNIDYLIGAGIDVLRGFRAANERGELNLGSGWDLLTDVIHLREQHGEPAAVAVALLAVHDDLRPDDMPGALKGDWRIEVDDDFPEAFDPDLPGRLWVVSSRTLYCDDKEIAKWKRCAVGEYDSAGQGWDVSEDTSGGDRLPEHIAILLEYLGLDDAIPDVPEPDRASDTYSPDSDGGYCVYWIAEGDEGRVEARYASYEAAAAVCEESNRALHSHCAGHLLCHYEVRVLRKGKWEALDADEA